MNYNHDLHYTIEIKICNKKIYVLHKTSTEIFSPMLRIGEKAMRAHRLLDEPLLTTPLCSR